MLFIASSIVINRARSPKFRKHMSMLALASIVTYHADDFQLLFHHWLLLLFHERDELDDLAADDAFHDLSCQ